MLVILTLWQFLTTWGAAAEETRSIDVGPLSVRVSVDSPVALSDTVRLSIAIIAPENVRIKPPAIGPRIGSFSVLGSQLEPPDELAGQFGKLLGWRWSARLEPMRLGKENLGELAIPYQEGSGDWQTVKIALPTIEVVKGPTSSDDPSTLRPIPDLSGNEWPTARVLRWLGSAGLLLAVIIWIAAQWRLRKQAETPIAAALRALADVERRAAATPAERRASVASIRDVVRAYLESAYRLHAPKQTTIEFLTAPDTAAKLTASQASALDEFLQSADASNFSADEPSADELAICLRRARGFLAGENTHD